MKKTFFILAVLVCGITCGITSNASAEQLKIGTVDVKKVFDNYYKTKDADQRINEDRNKLKKQLEDRTDEYKKLMDEFNKLNDEVKNPALSKETKEAKSRQLNDKISDLKVKESELKEFQYTTQKQLEEQFMRMRSGIVDEIRKVVSDRVKVEGYDLVFDKSGPSMNNVPMILYSRESWDFTDDIIATLNKNKSKGEAPAGNAETPAKAPAGKKVKN